MKKNILDFPKSKKGVSVLIGYVLLVVFAIVLSVVVYAWLKTYVPGDTLSCPDSISVFIKEASFNETTSILKLILINNGRFDIAGYFIRATNSSNQNQAIIDISSYLDTNYGGEVVGNSVLFSSVGGNVLKPGNQKTSIFNISSEIGKPYSIRIIPVRYQTEDNRERFVSCGDSGVLQIVGEPVLSGIIPPGTNSCDGQWEPGGVPEDSGVECDGGANCISPEETNGCTCEGGYVADGEGGCNSPGPATLFYDDFETYTETIGPNFHAEMTSKGWNVSDIDNGDIYDDIYLNDTLEYQGTYSVVVKDDSNITANINTQGYNEINLSYAARGYSFEGQDKLVVYWRVGNSGSWTNLEDITNENSWSTSQFSLSGAENQEIIQVRFYLDGSNTDYGLVDNFNVAGTV